MHPLRLGVNIDHVATIRQVRGVDYPDPVEAALAAERGGATGITVHLREDRRHIQEHDVRRLVGIVASKVNLEMAASDAMVDFACAVRPADVCLVPEKREELTTEGGLAVAGRERLLEPIVGRLTDAGIVVSLFIEPHTNEIAAAASVGAKFVELHTGSYANAAGSDLARELATIRDGATLAAARGLRVNAGHGLTLENVAPIAALPEIEELNIGHSIVARSIFVGIEEATREMLEACRQARTGERR
ncbi:MAG TPA: pyridoxine 5'-phosphate synthase [Candidatus Limnocylindrales bacterium]|nr:pyridoxine 5'-phosphate synthase [Candidatus Limnocylindrales bacterium]